MANKNGYVAITKFLIASPTKVRPVARVVNKKSCPAAMAILANMEHKGAHLIKATLKSAIANALDLNKELDEDMLYVSEIRVDEGPRLKRIWCRSHGRADQLLRRMCHITVVVGEKAQKAGK